VFANNLNKIPTIDPNQRPLGGRHLRYVGRRTRQ
jgi:hypothetical protein